MSDTQAIVALCGIALVSLLAFIAVTAFAWRSNVEIAKRLIGWFRTIPARYRVWRDPVLRKRVETIGAYEGALELMLMVKAQMTLMGAEEGVNEDVLGHRLRVANDAYVQAKREAASRIGAFDRTQLGIIAVHVAEQWFEGKIPPDEVQAFLEEEQQTLAGNPHAASGHMARAIARFGPRVAPA